MRLRFQCRCVIGAENGDFAAALSFSAWSAKIKMSLAWSRITRSRCFLPTTGKTGTSFRHWLKAFWGGEFSTGADKLTSRNRDDSLSLHESQDAIDRVFERRIRLAPCGSIPSRLIAGTVIAFELHRRDVVHGAHQKVQQRKEQIFLPASPDQLGNEIGDAKNLELPPGRLGNQSGNIQHVRVIVPRDMISLINRTRTGGNRNDIVSRDICGNETNLVQSIDSNAVIHHEGY